MYNPTKFSDRVKEARAAAKFGAVLQRDAKGRPTEVVVPGHDGKQYSVLISRMPREMPDGRTVHYVRAECRLVAGHIGYHICDGSTHGICYHIMAALILAAGDLDLYFSNSIDTISKVRHFGVKVVTPVYSRNCENGRPIYMAVRSVSDAQTEQEAA